MARIPSRDGSQIAFSRAGNGPALIIVTGALAHRTLDGDTLLVRKLMDRFTVYTYDRRGRGESGDTGPYAVDREIEDIEALIEHAGGRASLYGVSAGAALALQAAAKLGPARVSKLALYDTPYGQERRAFAAQKDRTVELARTGRPGDAAAFFLSAIGTPPEVLDGMKRSPEWAAIEKIDFTLAYDYAVLGDGTVPEAIVEAIAVPTLVMVGEKSMDFMHSAAARIASLVPDAQRRTIEGQSHDVEAGVMAPVLIEFLGKPR